MDFSVPFSALNERLKPQVTTTTTTTSDQLFSYLNKLEDRQLGSLRNKSNIRTTVLPEAAAPPPPQPNVSVTLAEPDGPREPEGSAEQEDSASASSGPEEEDCLSLRTACLIAELNLKDVGEEEEEEEEDPRDGDGSVSPSEQKDKPGELAPAPSGSPSLGGERGGFRPVTYEDGNLPDLVHIGRPLSRRRTVGHVSAELKEVRREVELSRRRSIKLKAQVDKLQESRNGTGWSKHRETVQAEVLSILGLLQPLTEASPPSVPPSQAGDSLDVALNQLQNVARKLAISHTKQEFKSGRGKEESVILQQALRDRDDAIEKKQGMEAELLRSKTEMMLLNNQLLEAVQKRLELSLELEAWKEDVQLILQQQLQVQQQAEQAQRKPSRLGLLRRTNRSPIQRPATFPLASVTPPTTNANQIFVPRAAAATAASPNPSAASTGGTPRNWRDKLRFGKSGRQAEDAAGQDPDGFQVVSLD